MSSILEAPALAGLVSRLERLGPGAERRWGTMSAGEMVCHLADATDWARGVRPTTGVTYPSRVHWTKWFALYTPMPWPKTVKTRPGFDPKLDGTRPEDFERDRRRAIDSLTALAATPPERLEPAHMMFGPMTRRDWGRWAYRHVDHHLRQFGG